MRIEKISAKNMIAMRSAEIVTKEPVQLFCGTNEAGKSSLAEGIRHAFTGESTRVTLKKDYRHLISDGETIGYTFIEFDGGKQACITLQNGTHELKEPLHYAIQYVLNPALFTSITSEERGRMLFNLSNLRSDGSEVKEKLLSRGCNPEKVEAVMPMLRSSFDNAMKFAAEKTKEERASWKAVTGEAYGDKKADAWQAEKPAIEVRIKEEIESNLSGLDERIESSNQKLGAMNARITDDQKRIVERDNHKFSAERIDRIIAKLEADRKQVSEWEDKVEETRKLAMGSSPGNVACACPSCGTELIFNGKELIERGGDLHGDEDAAVNLPKYEETLSMLKKSVANGERDLASAKLSKEKLDELNKETFEPVTQDQITAIKDEIRVLRDRSSQTQKELDDFNKSMRLSSEAETKTKKAAAHHAHVKEWDLIAAALSPDGIPGEMLASALFPINKRLAESASQTGWKKVVITSDMSVMYGDKPFSLSSESAKWRANAMLAEAISYLSGIKMIMLDGFDVLSLEGRMQLIKWIATISTKSEIDTVLLFGTLKAMPSGLPSCIECHWIENGQISGAQKEAA